MDYDVLCLAKAKRSCASSCCSDEGSRKGVSQPGEASTPQVCEGKLGGSSAYILTCSVRTCWGRTISELRARETLGWGKLRRLGEKGEHTPEEVVEPWSGKLCHNPSERAASRFSLP